MSPDEGRGFTTVAQAVAAATRRLAADPHLAATAHRDAETLLLHALSISRATLLAHPERALTPAEGLRYRELVERRLTLEPVQYILGQQEFYGIALSVTPAVLIPRPETELLVEAVLHRLPRNASLQIADIGTGSGAIAIAIAAHLPQAHLTAVDLSSAALDIARGNAERHGLAQRIRFLRSDLLSALPASASFDAILSNPPYVSESDRDTLHPQVRDHEPASALFAGASGLDIYRRLIPQALHALRPGGLLALEIGHAQQPPAAALLKGWNSVEFLNDLQAIPRVALARKP